MKDMNPPSVCFGIYLCPYPRKVMFPNVYRRTLLLPLPFPVHSRRLHIFLSIIFFLCLLLRLPTSASSPFGSCWRGNHLLRRRRRLVSFAKRSFRLFFLEGTRALPSRLFTVVATFAFPFTFLWRLFGRFTGRLSRPNALLRSSRLPSDRIQDHHIPRGNVQHPQQAHKQLKIWYDEY